MTHGALRHGAGKVVRVLFMQVAFDGPGIHADADRHVPCAARRDDRAYAVLAADVAGIDADFIRARRDGLHGKPVIKVDIRHDGNGEAALIS